MEYLLNYGYESNYLTFSYFFSRTGILYICLSFSQMNWYTNACFCTYYTGYISLIFVSYVFVLFGTDLNGLRWYISCSSLKIIVSSSKIRHTTSQFLRSITTTSSVPLSNHSRKSACLTFPASALTGLITIKGIIHIVNDYLVYIKILYAQSAACLLPSQ